jgi:hypothetical protein
MNRSGFTVAGRAGCAALAWVVFFAPAAPATAASPAPSFAAAGANGFGAAPVPVEIAAFGGIAIGAGAADGEAVAFAGTSDPAGLGLDVPPVVVAARGITGDGRSRSAAPFGTWRAKILLRSLTLPGWGQASLGRKTSAWVFGLAETGIWTSFTAFKIQEQLRRESYEKTALLFAGVQLDGRDDEFRRLVGSYLSSDEYNQLVVFRDAANQFYDDPAAYRAYIAAHSIGGANAWSWANVDDILRYRAQRQREQRAANRANTVLAIAIGNRLLSALHAARFAGATPPEARRWQIEYQPSLDQAGDFRLGVRTKF